MKTRVVMWLSLGLALGVLAGCGDVHLHDATVSTGQRRVVVYSAQDREFAEPVFRDYEKKTKVDVLPMFDVESTKTVGLANLILAEKSRPRCDLFWNNEILNTLRIKEQGLLSPFQPSHAADLPDTFKAKDGTWYGFAARARILIVNTKIVSETDRPRGIKDLLDPRWKGKIGMAKPLFGTTATHAACLFAAWGDEKARRFFLDLKANGVQVLSGNKQVATAVGSGQIAFGLTDTDDAMGEVDAGSPVAIVYPDRKPDEIGTLFIPNTLALIKGAPNVDAARALADHLLSPEVEAALAVGPSADPALEEHRGLGTGRDSEDRPRDGGRIRGRGEGLESDRGIPRLRVCRRLIASLPTTTPIDSDSRATSMSHRPVHSFGRATVGAGIVRGLALIALIGMSARGIPAPAADGSKAVWNFESDQPGKIAKGFTGEVGTWQVALDGDNRVLAQKARNDDDTFNVALVDGTRFKDVDLTVRLKAVAGELDRGGGLVWCARDKDNYYIARYNPLEDNFRVYKVEAGKRTQFQSAKVPGDTKWHTLRVTMSGTRIACYLDGTKHLEADDPTFPDAGKIGLWSKADAQSYFDDLIVVGE